MMRAMKYLDNARLNIAGGTAEQIKGLQLFAKEMDVKRKLTFLVLSILNNAFRRLLNMIFVCCL